VSNPGEPEARPVCPDCGREIDPEVCWCGETKAGHDPFWFGHSFVPMGCDCGREPATPAKTGDCV